MFHDDRFGDMGRRPEDDNRIPGKLNSPFVPKEEETIDEKIPGGPSSSVPHSKRFKEIKKLSNLIRLNNFKN